MRIQSTLPSIKPHLLWFTGLSGAGKTTLASMVACYLDEQHRPSKLLDGDVHRRTTSRDLGFSEADRRENIRRLGQLASDAVEDGYVAIVAAISPLRDAREAVRQNLPPGRYVEVFVDAPLTVCEARDPKGLYRRVRQGLIQQFTGFDSVYEAPVTPDIHLRTDQLSPQECLDLIVGYLREHQGELS